MHELLSAFRETGPEAKRFVGESRSRTALARAYFTALESRDSNALSELAVTRDEFGWLVFPEHVYATAPYELDPAIFWLQLQAKSSAGIKRVMTRLAGRPLRLVSMECTLDTLQSRSPQVQFWSPCRVRYLDGSNVRIERLFGTIVEHRGLYKFLSYANEY